MGILRDVMERDLGFEFGEHYILGTTLVMNDWSRFNPYETDFGTGKPFWFDATSRPIPGLVYH